ncbi:MAG: NTP transferase domain-containing protein [Bacteroidetes bacterium]|nr:NTP transferase domain-containing protein [Bacteroidota bacterium]
MKVVIPVAGIGSRLKPHTHTQPKSLIPVAGKPILGHIMDRLTKAGLKDFVFIIGYLGDKIEQYISKEYPDCHCTFVIQTLGKGTGHAIWLARDYIEPDEELFIVLGDTIFEADLNEVLRSEYSTLGVKKVEDPRLFGVAEVSEDNSITRLVEKPKIPKSNLALVGLYKIRESRALLDCIQYLIDNEIRTQNEFHLTDALMCMISRGIRIQTFPVEQWFDCGKKDIILQTNRMLLDRLDGTAVQGHRFPGTILVEPVYIGHNVQIKDSIIGPHVSIGDDAIISRSIIRNSIIGPSAELLNAIMEDSLVGNDATLVGAVQSLNLGDSAEIKLS